MLIVYLFIFFVFPVSFCFSHTFELYTNTVNLLPVIETQRLLNKYNKDLSYTKRTKKNISSDKNIT